MIKATIAGESFVLQSLKDAELLLQILDRATPVVSRHVGPEYREVLYAPACRPEFSGAISGAAQILSADEYQALRDADTARAAAAAAAASQVPA